MAIPPKIWYYGTTLIEAQKIAKGDYSVFSTGGGTFYKQVHQRPNRAIVMAERAIQDDRDEPAIVELLIKDRSHDSGNRIKIRSTRIVSEAEILRRTGRTFDRVDANKLSEGVITRAINRIYTVQCETACYQCTLRGKWKTAGGGVDPVTVGDRVKIEIIDRQTGVIQAVMRRKNQYTRKRTNAGKRTKKSSHTIVANLDGLIIVCATKDPPIWQQMVDTYLVMAEVADMQPLICVNKIDLVADRGPILDLLSVYEQLGYDTLSTSAVTGEGIGRLRGWMKDKISAVAGLSGVGKSALLNAIQPGLQLKTGALNTKRKEGRHTTVATELLRLEVGGFIADTPGIRGLDLLDVEARVMDSYFPEMRQIREGCERNPCTHLREAGCAVKDAVGEGRIAESRYKSYCELRKQARP